MDNAPWQAVGDGMKPEHDLIIVGGGLNGAALALAAAKAGFAVALLDQLPRATQEAADFDGRAYALAHASCRMLRALGLWDGLSGHAQPMLEIKVTDGRAGEGASPWMLHFDHAELEEGPMGHLIEDRHLRRVLARALEDEPGVTHLPQTRVTDQHVTPAGVAVTTQDGSQITGSLLIGADGRGSGTAGRAGIGRQGWGYGQTAIVCAVAHELPHNGIAHQFFMPNGPLAILPVPGNRCSIVWSESDARAAEIIAMDDAGFLDALRPAFGSFLGDISLAGGRFTYPLGLTLANSFTADRIALVGDAAHGMHPIAGQGLNAGLRDVAALAEVLGAARRRGEDIGAAQVLARYQGWRRFDTASLAMATDGFNRLFSNDNPVLRGARDLGMGLVNALPAVRRHSRGMR
jgi:2-octaprenyl-6-methoxyphenol hydroxylase